MVAKKIQFISNYGDLYGANRSLLSLVESFYLKGYDISVMLPAKGGMSDELSKIGVPFHVFPYHSSVFYVKFRAKYLVLPFLIIGDILAFPLILFKVKKFNPDIVYSNTSAENLGIFIAKLLGKKHISHIREFMDLDHGAYFWLGKRAKKKFINQSNGVIFVSKSVAEAVMLGESLSEKHKVVYNGIPCSKHFTARSIVSKKNIHAGVVGIFEEGKGQDTALRYFRKLSEKYPNIRLHFYGDKAGAYKQKLYAFVNNNSLSSKVIFHGFEKETEKIYADIDILLVFACNEGFGRVTIEAMSRGIPVIGYNSGGTAELIQNNYNGFLFKDYDEFESSVWQILNEDVYCSLSANAILYVTDNFSVGKYFEQIESFVLNISS